MASTHVSLLHTTSSTLPLLAEFGPDAPSPTAPTQADVLAYCRRLSRARHENFPVLTRLLHPSMVDPLAAVYAFCRWADDLADEALPGSPDGAATQRSDDAGAVEEGGRRRLALLGWWRGRAEAWHAGEPPTHPVFVALGAISGGLPGPLPLRPFLDLISAFEQDQRVAAYETWEDLCAYCERSANPVGRLILALAGVPDTAVAADHEMPTARRHLLEQADALCTALQLTNFWQDTRSDLLERGRVYMPRGLTGLGHDTLREFAGRSNDAAARVPYILALRPLVQRTHELFEQSCDLHRLVPATIATPVRLFHAGGLATLRRIEAGGCTTLWRRPALSKFDKSLVVLRAMVWARASRRGVPT